MNILDTRNLINERDELKQQVLDSFLEEFEHYADMTESFEDIRFGEEEIQGWESDWADELEQILEINKLEEEIGEENFEFGVTLIDEDDFEDFVVEDLEQIGYIPKDFPSWIEIDWEATVNNVKQDYSEVEFQAGTYLYRL
jgi:hypothetical protein